MSSSISVSHLSLHLPSLNDNPPHFTTKSYDSSPRDPLPDHQQMKASLQLYGAVSRHTHRVSVSNSTLNSMKPIAQRKPPIGKGLHTVLATRRESMYQRMHRRTLSGRPGISQKHLIDTMAESMDLEGKTHKSDSHIASPHPEELRNVPIGARMKLKGPLEIHPVLNLRRIESKELMRSDSDEDAVLPPVASTTHRSQPALKVQLPPTKEYLDYLSTRQLAQTVRQMMTDYNFATAAVLNATQTRFREVQKLPQRLFGV